MFDIGKRNCKKTKKKLLFALIFILYVEDLTTNKKILNIRRFCTDTPCFGIFSIYVNVKNNYQ